MIDEYVFRSKYARYNKLEKRRESWDESVDRMMGMHLKKYPELKEEIEECGRLMKNKKLTGSQRALQFGGTAIEEKNMRLYNCVSSYADRVRFFGEAIWLLLCGCGVGFSVQRHHVAKLPEVKEVGYPYDHIVEDSIEGWADAINALFNAYLNGDEYPYFDFSNIRKKGSPLRFGGKAPGPEPLSKALNNIESVLKGAMFRQLKPIEVFDCVMHLADSVLSAGIRRSATIATFDINDEEMLCSKTGNWFETNPQRGRANISAIATPTTTKAEYEKIFEFTKQFGEPGIIFLESKEYSVNPCVEIMMCPTLIKHNGKIVEKYNKTLLDHTKREYWVEQGYTFESGWQACNLSTINVSNLDSVEEFNHVSRHAGILGTIQASYSKTNYLGLVSQQIIERESLLGVSLCGILDKPEITLNGIHLRNAAREVKKANEEYAEKIGIPKASRTTCVKPEGTSSIVLNSSSGIHPHHSKKYIRRVNANLDEPIFQKFNSQNPHAVEDSVWGADKVISFALEAPKNAMVKSDLDAVSFMRIAKLVYLNWVVGGNQVKRLEKANHNVSITVSVEKHEWDKVKDFLWEEKDHFCGVSFLSSSGDYDYQQAPFQRVYEPHQQTTEEHKRMWEYWNLLKEKTKYVDYDNLFEEIDTTKPMEQIACGNGACQII